MSTMLSPSAANLLDRPVLAVLTTLNADGSPHATPLWIDREGDVLRINTAQGRVKARNMARDPRVAICLVDPDDSQHVLAITGHVVELTTRGADEHIDGLAHKYTGSERFLARVPGQVRLLARIAIDKVVMD